MFKELVTKNRSIRRFDQSSPIREEVLRELIDTARLSASGANKQPLRYLISNTPQRNALIFDQTAWAGYLTQWPGPAEGERPAAYILILLDQKCASDPGHDCGIAAQTITLAAAEKGLGCCLIGNLKRKRLQELLAIPARYRILLAVALGIPAETVSLEEAVGNEIRYWRSEDGVHHVPKRPLSELIISQDS